jgi:polyphosphate glucokinase
MGEAREHDRSGLSLERPFTLGIDVGGTHIKAGVIDAAGRAATERLEIDTPRPAVPASVVRAIVELAEPLDFDRVSIGFPGVVVDGVTQTAPNLDAGWDGYPLAGELSQKLEKPLRVCNDADLAGLGAVEGFGVEMLITLGTGMGSAVYLDGRLVPNLELGHHPFGDGMTYEERVSDRALSAVGEDAWRERVVENVELTRRIWNWRRLYLGGGNARLFRPEHLPEDVLLVSNQAGVLSAVKLWKDDRREP